MLQLGLRVSVLLVSSWAIGCSGSPARAQQEARLLADKGQTDEAIQLLEGELRRRPAAIAERRLLIRLYGAVGDLGAAGRHAEVLASHSGPQSPLPWLELGHAQELAHHYDAALDLFDLAARLAPSDPAGPRTGGVRAAAWGELELAEPRLVEALRRDPKDARTWHTLGLVRAQRHDLNGADAAYRAGLMADPSGVDNRIGLATLALLRDDPSRVLAEYEAILRMRPAFADAELGRSWALVRLGRYSEARAALERAVRLGADPVSVAKQQTWLREQQAKSATTR
jgi:tetratricopeptide (TPR) repeat protein